MENLNTTILANTPFLLPPLAEQHHIVQRVLQASTQINSVVEKLHDQVGLIQEYRQALITAAVTGQIDIRQWENVQTEAMPS